MSVSSAGLNPSLQSVGTSGGRSAIRQARQDFDQLVRALQSGNLGAAQQAYNSFQQLQTGQTSATATQPSTVTTTATANPVASDWSALGLALQSGSLSSAQGALGALQQDAQTAWQTHLQQKTRDAQSVYALMQGAQAAAPGATSTNATSAATSVQSDLNALSQALQSGDSSGAQKLLAQLEQDLQTSGQASIQNHGRHHHHHHGGYSGLNPASAYPTTTPTAATGTLGSSGTGAAA